MKLRSYILLLIILKCNIIFSQVNTEIIQYIDDEPIPLFVDTLNQQKKTKSNVERVFSVENIAPTYSYVQNFAANQDHVLLNIVPFNTSNYAVGEIPYTIDISPSGTTTAQIPIDGLGGIAGLKPNISLVYNNMSGNGVAGYGWNIAGISSISYRNKNIYYDVHPAPASINDDQLVLDGKRLIFKESISNNKYYYLESSNGAITAVNNGIQISVYNSNGTMAIYKDLSGSNIFQLISITDRYKNTIEYNYLVDKRMCYIQNIQYGRNIEKNTSHFATITFNYEDRNDRYLFLNIGKEIAVEKRIKSIVTNNLTYSLTYNNDFYSRLTSVGCRGKNGVLLSDFSPLKFSYGDATTAESGMKKEESTLSTWFIKSDDDGRDLKGNELSIYTGPLSKTGKEGMVMLPKREAYAWGRKTDDGAQSLHSLYSENQDIVLTPSYEDIINHRYTVVKAEGGFRALVTIDLDNNPLSKEVVLINANAGYRGGKQSIKFRTYKLNSLSATGFELDNNTSKEYIIKAAEYNDNHYYSVTPIAYQTGDFRGDGRQSILGVQSHSGTKNLDCPSLLYIFDLRIGMMTEPQMIIPPKNIETDDVVITMDYDGDGKDDLFHFHETGFDIYSFEIGLFPSLSLRHITSSTFITRASFETEKINGLWPLFSRRSVFFGDVNGDGKLDIVHVYKYQNSAIRVNSYLSDGNGNFVTKRSEIPATSSLPDWKKDRDSFMHDFNGDGKADLVFFNDGNMNVWFSDGEKINPTVNGVYGLDGLDVEGKFFSADFKDPNVDRMIGYTKGSKIVRLSLKRNELRNAFMTSATSSLGKKTDILYSRIDIENLSSIDGYTIYSRGIGAQYPFQNYNGYYWVAHQLKNTIKSKTGQDFVLDKIGYSYSNAIVHRQGLGFRGFETIRKSDLINRTYNYTVYDPLNWGIIKQATDLSKIIDYDYSISYTSKKEPIIRLIQEKENNALIGVEKIINNTYDDYGNITKAIIEYGNDLTEEKTFEYKNVISGTLNLVGLPLNVQTKRIKNSESFIESTHYTYNDKNLPSVVVINTNGNIVSSESYTYDEFSNLKSEEESPYGVENNKVRKEYTYSANGQLLISSKNALGKATTYNYSSNYLLTSIKDHKNNLTTYEYDAFRRPIKTTSSDGVVSQTYYTWDSKFGASYKVSNSSSNEPTEEFYHDQVGRKIASGEQRFDNTYLYTQTEYNSKGLIARTSLPSKSINPTKWNTSEYDMYNRLVSVDYASGKKDTYSYPWGRNNIQSTIDNVITTKEYDAAGRLTKVSDPSGIITYDLRPDGQPKSITAPGSVSTRFEYDNYGRQTKLIDPSAGTKTFAYDVVNNVVTETDARGKIIKITSDKYGLLKRKEIVGEITTNYNYDDSGLLISEISSNNTSKTYIYDNLMQLVSEKEIITDNKFLQRDYTYNSGTLAQVDYKSQTGNIVSEKYTYSNGHHTETHATPIEATSSTLELINSVLIDTKNAAKVMVNVGTINVNEEKRLSYQQICDGKIPFYQFIFKTTGPMVIEVTSEFMDSFPFESFTIGMVGANFEYISGNIFKVYASGSFGLVIQRKEACLGKEGLILSKEFPFIMKAYPIDYNPPTPSILVWKLESENDMGMPVSVKTGRLNRIYSFDSYGMPTARSVKKELLPVQNFTYEFDHRTGNLKWRKDNTRNIQENFGYDEMNRLIAFNGVARSYDIKGNITDDSSIGRFDYNSSKPYAVEYVTPYGNSVPLRNQEISYNGMHRPTLIKENGYEASLTYDGDGSRTKMHIKKNNANHLTRYYMGGQYEIENGISGDKEFLYLDGDAYSAPAVYIRENGEWKIHYLCRDYLGSITHITDADGNLEQELSYDAWGRLRNPVNQIVYTADNQPALLLGRGYTGHEHLSMFGLINMNARLYDPVLGRFLSPDPYVQDPLFSQNFNRYSYCLNNPLRYTDPTGEYALVDDLIAAAIGGVINVVSNAISGDITSFGHGLALFGVGAAGGWASLYATPLAGGVIMGAGNSIVNQGFTNGWDNIGWEQVGLDMTVGGLTSALTMGMSKFAGPYINNLTSGITSPALKEITTHSMTGTISGFSLNTAFSLANGDSFGTAMENGGKGALMGFAYGTVSGTVYGMRSAYQQGLNPWTGKEIISERAQAQFDNHANSGNRHSDLNLTPDELLLKTNELVMNNRFKLGSGSNTMQGTINGIEKTIIVNVDPQTGQIRSLNLYPDHSNRNTQYPVIKFGNIKW